MPRLASAAIAALIVLLPAFADEPAYPHPLPEWYRTRLAELQSKKVNVDVVDMPLDRVLERLGKQVGVPITLELFGGKEAGPLVLNVKELRLKHALELIATFEGLRALPTPTGFVVTNRPAKFPQPEHAAVRARIRDMHRRLKRAAEKRERDEGGPNKTEKARLALTREISFAVAGNIVDAVQKLREQIGVNIVIDPKVMPLRQETKVDMKDTAAGVVLKKLIAGTKTDFIVTNGVAFITTQANADGFRDRLARAAKHRALVEARLDKPLAASPQGLSIGRLASFLKTNAGGEIMAGPEAWKTAAVLDGCAKGMTLRALRDRVSRLGVEMIVELDRIWLLRTKKD